MRQKSITIFFLLAFFIAFALLFRATEGVNDYRSLNGDLFQDISAQFQQLNQKKALIIFNSGGWGDTPLEEAEDFASVIKGIQNTLDQWGYQSVVIPYNRTKNNFLGRIDGTKEVLDSFQTQSEELAGEIAIFLENNPGTEVIVAGLSMGGTFVNETMESLSRYSAIETVYAVEAGVPFWVQRFESDNVLELDNNKKDTLATGEIKTLLASLIKAPGKWFLAKIQGEELAFSEAVEAPRHKYQWSSPEVGPEIVGFLKNKLAK